MGAPTLRRVLFAIAGGLLSAGLGLIVSISGGLLASVVVAFAALVFESYFGGFYALGLIFWAGVAGIVVGAALGSIRGYKVAASRERARPIDSAIAARARDELSTR